MKKKLTISTSEAARRLDVTGSTVRNWCKLGFGIRLMGRWRIPETRIAEIEGDLAGAGSAVPPCRTPTE